MLLNELVVTLAADIIRPCCAEDREGENQGLDSRSSQPIRAQAVRHLHDGPLGAVTGGRRQREKEFI